MLHATTTCLSHGGYDGTAGSEIIISIFPFRRAHCFRSEMKENENEYKHVSDMFNAAVNCTT